MGLVFPVLIALLLIPLGSFFASAEVDDGYTSAGSCGTQIIMGHGAVLIDDGANRDIGCGKSRLWIEGSPDCDKRSDISMPESSRAVEVIAPGASGYMMLYRRLPTGDLQTRYMGYVYSGRKYRLEFCADYPGSHEVWYKVGFEESDRIRFHVFI